MGLSKIRLLNLSILFSTVRMDELDQYAKAFQRLRCDKPGGRPRPHKAVMLLAVSLLAEADELPENRIEFDNRLLEIFACLFEVAKQFDDKKTPHNPFFHLKSEKFWHLHPVKGRAAALSYMKTVRGPGELKEAVAYASLDPELYVLLHDPEARRELQAILIQHYCPHASDAMWKALAQESQIESRKQKLLREEFALYTTAQDPIRSTAFRRMIREIYDVRCAACGIRFFFGDLDIIDAAHLIPFSESKDDRPQNGIALCKNHHWLMDGHIMVPGPGGRSRDYAQPVWHVHKDLDDRYEEHKSVLQWKGRKVILPKESRYAPSREALDWRMERLREMEGAST